jgi:hypothetical protein
MNYPCYFKEGFTPPAGIDTITIWLHPAIIANPQLFHKQCNNNNGINLRFKQEINHRTNELIRTNFIVDIQAEAIDPNNDISFQVISILESLTFNDVLHRPQGIDIFDLKSFFQNNFDRLFALDGLDFYFDLRNDDIRLLGKPNPKCPNIRYSSVYPSVLKAYHRSERLKHKRNISYEEIDNMEYPERIEFSLCRGNCEYLNIRNLAGTYDNIFLRYLPFLARKWFNNRHEVVEVNKRNLVNYAHHLNQIIAVAGQRIPQYDDLYKTPPKPIPYKSARRNEVDYNFIARFYSRM